MEPGTSFPMLFRHGTGIKIFEKICFEKEVAGTPS
jgi:hypothetical protein